jgi:hypothetical protein
MSRIMTLVSMHLGVDRSAPILSPFGCGAIYLMKRHELVHQFLEASYGYPLSFCFDENGGSIMGVECASLLADNGFDRNEMCDEIGMKYPCTTSFCKKCTNIECMRGWNNSENCMECPDLCLADGTGNWQREEIAFVLKKFFPDICPA